MTRRWQILLLAFTAPFAAVAPAWSQSVLQVTAAVAGGIPSSVLPGGSVSVTAAGLAQPVLVNVTVQYTGSSTANITGISIAGTSEITAASTSPLPVTLNPAGSTSFTVQYLPSTGNAVTGQVSIAFTAGGQPAGFSFVVIGSAPNLAFSYFFAPGGGLTDMRSGDRITFPSTNVGASVTATVTVLNRGSATGVLQTVTLTGAAYQLSGSPAPAQLRPGEQVSFNVIFVPQTTGGTQGLLALGLPNGSLTFSLAGTGTAPTLAVSYALADGNVYPLADSSLISFPSIDINAVSTATIEVLNQGTGTGTLSGVAISGRGFRLSGVPLLPATIGAGQSLRFGIVFAPPQAGGFTGAFRIDLTGRSISGTLSGNTAMPGFTVSYSFADGIARGFADGGTISFPTVDVNGSTTATIEVLNQGTGAGSLSSVWLSGAGFRLTGLPQMPATIPAGQALRFGIVFTPSQSGSFTGSFRIDLTGRSITGSLTASTALPNFTVAYNFSDGIVHTHSDGGTIDFPAVDINATVTATIGVLNQGAGEGTVKAIVVSGNGFRLSQLPLMPATVAPGRVLTFGIVFAPSRAGTFTGTFRIDLADRSISGAVTGSTATSDISLSYVDPQTGNILSLPDSATLWFPKTPVAATTSITVMAANTGSGTGFVNSIALGGDAPSTFQLLGLPPFPVAVPPAQQLRFGIRFSPEQQQIFSATLTVNLNGQTVTIRILAQGTGPQFTYTCLDAKGTTPFSPDGTVAIADTAVGQMSSVTISIVNTGSSDGQIRGIGVSGQGFSLADLPAIPITLQPNASQRFTLNFAPAQAEVVNGRLTIGTDTFTVTGTGIGSRLIYTYNNLASATPVLDGGVVIFTPTSVGDTGSVDFSIQNTGTSTATISSISLSASSATFALKNLPALPLKLDVGATVSFPMAFTPNTTGGLTATLRINTSSFTVSGTGTAPAPLPAYKFEAPGVNIQPAQQPAIGLTLSAPYPLPLQGTLTLTFVSDVFTDDPAIQFASGGRTVKFTIPANSTQGLFNGISTAIPLQTGTTAGNIVITPSFAMQGGFDLTPTSPAPLTIAIPRSAPQLLNGSVTAQTLNTFTVALNGFSTPRALRQLEIQITPKAGENFNSTHLTLDVNSAAAGWFQTAASQGFGGSFQITIPFVLQNGSTTDDLVHRLQSISITATNESGSSGNLSIPIP